MAGLTTYRSKRAFGITAEPKGKVGRRRGQAFVVQQHDATRLHYDLRLELDGVMKSWAVTRGPSMVPGNKRLAVQTEDHPIDYNKFEGTIPKGQYGGGTVMIWDRGTWQPEADPQKGMKKGHLAFTLDGEKLQGGWHLVRMHRRPGEKRDNWLLIKQDDAAARSKRDKDILAEMPLSVTTGRTLDEIAKGAAKKKSTAEKPAKSAKPTKRASTASTPRKKAAKKQATRGAALPDFVPPSLATLAENAPDSANWIHEIKFDGYRIQARLDGGKVKLLTRNGLDWTGKFATVAGAVADLPAETALIDGEIVVEDDDGVSSFSLLQQDLKAGRHDRMVFYVFDLLHLDGADLRQRPLSERKAALTELLKRAPAKGAIRLSESIDETGSVLLKHACRMNLEGIISKREDAPYRSGRSRDWIKTKCSDRQEFVVAGFMPSTADARAVGALVLGVYEGDKLRYAGRTGTGFTHQIARDLYRKLKALRRSDTPFASLPAEERGVRGPVWVAPTTVVEVDVRGWTHGDRVRHASYQGLREDKDAREVVREVKKVAAAKAATDKRRSAPVTKTKKQTAKKTTAVKSSNSKVSVGAIALSNPERVYWEDAGVTKRDLAEFYKAIWKWMRPHVAGRPISLLRCPEGAAGQCFFQKHAAAGISADHLSLIPEDDDKIISIEDIDGLISLVQAGVLEVHVRGSKGDNLANADRLVFDLDPGPGTGWKDVVAAARDVRERLAGIKLTTFLKTTGGKGLHVVLPIAPTPWDEAKAFARGVAEAMAADSPDRYTAAISKSKRNDRIFIDYLRNSREATAVAPYSTRARPGAPVSVPIDWAELGSLKGANAYTVLNLPARLSRQRKDPWATIGRFKQKLPRLK
ncbi:MAG: DNA ligase D [Pseudolabrys sp.]|nr:DNA ligase D [Pseudolabrys sp.]